MKTSFFISIVLITLCSLQVSFGQSTLPSKTQVLKVWGECTRCKKTIESSALKAGASNANWNTKTKMLNVSYHPGKTDLAKIEQAIALAGYDTQDVTADSTAYNKLEECCQYDRKSGGTSKIEAQQ